MHIEGYEIKLEIVETKEKISMELIFLIGEREKDKDLVGKKVKAQIETQARGRKFKILGIMRNQHCLDYLLLQ